MLPAIAVLAFFVLPTPIDRAFERLYNFDFPGAQAFLDGHLKANPSDGLAQAVRASAFLFQELHRLQILESEFFAEDKRVIEKKKMIPDPATRQAFQLALQTAQAEARRVLASNSADANALFTMSLASGLQADYLALVEKRQWQSLSSFKESQTWSLRLLNSHPDFADAELTSGACEYLIGSLPFFLRWFVKIDGVEGEKSRAAQKLERVAASGRYLGPFARILLAIVHLRDKQPARALTILNRLSKDYPQNPLFRNEANKVASLVGR